jgi:signal transduction histidine kinase
LVSGQLQRIQTTLRELVNFSRPASTERARVHVKDILDEALSVAKYYRGTAGRKGRRADGPDGAADKVRCLEVRIADGLPCLWGVRDQLVQVFLNLILNAVDATAHGGRIAVDAELQGEAVRVAVQDDGNGITAADQKRLFQPYFTTKRHGTGLGLFVSHQLVAEHGGRIAFTSEPGRGTTFEVYLPAESWSSQPACTTEEGPHAPAAEDRHDPGRR